MKKIVPFLWFDNQAKEAADFYASVFDGSHVGRGANYSEASSNASGMPAGSVMTVPFHIAGEDFVALNGGPGFKFTPAISFFITSGSESMVDKAWKKLIDGGEALMPLQKYPFSEKFGWLHDKFGLSWQLNYAPGSSFNLNPFMLFVGKQNGRAEEAAHFYASVFELSKVLRMERFQKGEQGLEGTIKHGIVSLNGQSFMMMDSNLEHNFTFNEAVSFVVNCESQDEIDYFWKRLSEGGDESAQQCGWLKDKFGVSWQVVPASLNDLLTGKDPSKSQRVMKEILQMKKIDMNKLQEVLKS